MKEFENAHAVIIIYCHSRGPSDDPRCKALKLPSVTAYLVAGVLIGPYCLGLLGIEGLGFPTQEDVDSLSLISEVALGFIAFSIGSEFRVSELKHTGKQAFVVGVLQALAATFFGRYRPDCHRAAYKRQAVHCAGYYPRRDCHGDGPCCDAHAVVRQYKAKGPLVDLLLPIVALDDAVGLVVFAVSFGIAKALNTGSFDVISIVVDPLIEIVCSLALGALGGWQVLTQLEKLFNSNTNRLNMTIAFVFLTSALAMAEFKIGPVTIGFSSLLTCMMLGTLFCNLCPLSGEIMEKSDRWTSPLFAAFFVISGAGLDLGVFKDGMIVLIGVVYILTRSLGKYFGAHYSAKLMKCEPQICKYLGITLLPQAGVALGMCVTARSLGAEGDLIRNITLFAILIYELVGPLLTKMALQAAGEIHPMDEAVRNRRQHNLEQVNAGKK